MIGSLWLSIFMLKIDNRQLNADFCLPESESKHLGLYH